MTQTTAALYTEAPVPCLAFGRLALARGQSAGRAMKSGGQELRPSRYMMPQGIERRAEPASWACGASLMGFFLDSCCVLRPSYTMFALKLSPATAHFCLLFPLQLCPTHSPSPAVSRSACLPDRSLNHHSAQPKFHWRSTRQSRDGDHLLSRDLNCF